MSVLFEYFCDVLVLDKIKNITVLIRSISLAGLAVFFSLFISQNFCSGACLSEKQSEKQQEEIEKTEKKIKYLSDLYKKSKGLSNNQTIFIDTKHYIYLYFLLVIPYIYIQSKSKYILFCQWLM